MKINKKGFTLIELLAVIVILGIIMVIAVPMVQEYILKSRKEGFTKTANGVIDAANLYYSNEAANNTSNSLEFTCTTKECKTTTNERLDIKGKPDKGTIKVFGDGEIIACFQRDTWYAVKNIGDKEAKFGEGTCEYNEETKSYDTIKLVSQEMVDNLTNQLKELQEKGDAKASEILDTKKAVVKGIELTGTMPNNGLLNWNPTSSESKTITPGYYSGGTISTEGAYTVGLNDGSSSKSIEFAGRTMITGNGDIGTYTIPKDGYFIYTNLNAQGMITMDNTYNQTQLDVYSGYFKVKAGTHSFKATTVGPNAVIIMSMVY